MVDLARALRVAVTTGEIRFGYSEARRAAQKKEAKLVVVARNCPADQLEAFKKAGAKVKQYEGNNFDLGAVCGKPFAVSSLAVVKAGESDILTGA